MTSSPDPTRFASELLMQDEALSDAQYQEYRGKLESALRATERRGTWAGRVVAVSCVLTVVLMFVGGSKAVGDFDPWSKGATPVSTALGLVFTLAIVVFLLSSMIYFWWYRPGIINAKDRVRDANILALQRQIRELRERGATTSRHEKTNPETDVSAES